MAKPLRKHPLGLRVWLHLQGENRLPLHFDHPTAEELQVGFPDNLVVVLQDLSHEWVATYERSQVLMIQPIPDLEEQKSA